MEDRGLRLGEDPRFVRQTNSDQQIGMRTTHCGRELGQYIGRRGLGYIRRHWDIDLIVRSAASAAS